ncbi:hypothetical protein [Flavobacterium sp. XGLA_31]|uniref:hypothetical protein n=1 Tax=Flavobacterium sp. XGLA_31 TaxID=3447666 RepID=UPI003F32BB44
MRNLFLILALLSISLTQAQKEKVGFSFYDGVVIMGYVDGGGYLNFTGPNINATYGESKFIIGMLPSLRFKEDKGTTKNAFVTPTLGMGLTYSYKAWAFQIPLYYNAKTATQDGQWHIGFGIGLRLNKLQKNKS